MPRVVPVMLVTMLSLLTAAKAAEPDLNGNWKVVLLVQGQQPTLWLLSFASKEGKMTAKVLSTSDGFPAGAEVEKLRLDGDDLRFGVRVGELAWTFEGKCGKADAKKITGSFDLGGRQVLPAFLEPTTLTSLDPFDVGKEILNGKPTDVQVFEGTFAVLPQAEAKKAAPSEVRGWAERAFKLAEGYGPRWQREVALRIAEALASQATFASIGVEYARRVERMMDANAESAAQLRTLNALSKALRKAGKAKEADEFQAKIDKIEVQAYEDYARKIMPFKPQPFAGRKANSGRTVLVELFTGAQCPPCVAADLAFDALAKTYKTSDVVLLQYHLNIPAPDPLTNAESEARQRYYGDAIEGTPTIFFNGKSDAPGGGFANAAEDKYKEYRDVINPLLEKPGRLALQAKAVRTGNIIEIGAEVSGLEVTGDKVRLRFVLTEEWANYMGANRLRYHHQVVRAMPGGASGISLKDKASKHRETVDLEEVRKRLDRFLNSSEFKGDTPAMNLQRLGLIAFVQNDETKEVLHAVRVNLVTSEAGTKP